MHQYFHQYRYSGDSLLNSIRIHGTVYLIQAYCFGLFIITGILCEPVRNAACQPLIFVES